jgi:hypothetical protein
VEREGPTGGGRRRRSAQARQGARSRFGLFDEPFAWVEWRGEEEEERVCRAH